MVELFVGFQGLESYDLSFSEHWKFSRNSFQGLEKNCGTSNKPG